MAKIAETEALSVSSSSRALTPDQCREGCSEPSQSVGDDDWRPKRLVRTVLSSIAESKDFGKQMERQGQRPLKRCSSKDFQHVIIVPTTTAAFHDETCAVGMLLQE